MLRISLKYRIAIIIFILEALMMTAVLWSTLDNSENSIREQFASNERAVLEVMSGISHIALLTEEYSEIQPYFENLLQDSRIEQVMLVDSRGIVVAGTRPESIGRFPSAFSSVETIDETNQGRRAWRSSEIRNDNRLLGVLAIEISDVALSAATAEARRLGISIAAIGMVLIAIVGLIAGSLLTWRLTTVTEATRRFAAGDRSARTGFRGTDEMRKLGQTFDEMADNLQQSANESILLIEQLSDKNAELEQFAYTVSHDLKSPLVTVKGFIGLLQKDLREGDFDRVEKDMAHIVNAADTMGNLLEDLLELSRVGRVVNIPEKVSLTELFEGVVDTMNIQIESQGVNLKVQQQMPEIHVDKQRMSEVAQNLLENALKFSRESNPPEIAVSARVEDSKVICCVADNGIGIESQFQEQVFGLFNRLHQSYEGTGIGLALVKRIIEVHDGYIWIESSGNGSGSKFYFALPKEPQAA